MNRTDAAAQQIRAPDERARSIDAVLDTSMYPATGGITLWRANRLARYAGRTIATGYDELSAQLPGRGWPTGSLVEFLLQQPGIGELRLLGPALASAGKRPMLLLQPTAIPNVAGLSYIGLPVEKLRLLTPSNTADALWSAEQILRSGSCGALLFWLSHVRQQSLRRLHLVAKESDTLFVVFRPLVGADDSSPAELRLVLRPADDGIQVEILKRKGPVAGGPMVIRLRPSTDLASPHGRSPRRVETPVAHVRVKDPTHA